MAEILLAEDDESLRVFLAKALTRAGHAVIHCGDGDEALTWVETRGADFDLLLADIVMPGLDGIELARRAAEILPNLRVLFITGFAAGRFTPIVPARHRMPACCPNRFI